VEYHLAKTDPLEVIFGPKNGFSYGKCPFPKWEGCETNSSSRNGSQLLVRWLQHGALSAVDRTHCGGCNRLFWTFPNFDAMKGAMYLRNALFPYIYSSNHVTRTTGVALVHPVYYEAPLSEKAHVIHTFPLAFTPTRPFLCCSRTLL
jgi:hypothetical protein